MAVVLGFDAERGVHGHLLRIGEGSIQDIGRTHVETAGEACGKIRQDDRKWITLVEFSCHVSLHQSDGDGGQDDEQPGLP